MSANIPDSTKTILVVDHETQVRSMLKTYLLSEGFDVIEAESCVKALAILEQNRHRAVDVLVTDIEMPHMDGITLIERCKQHFPNLRVVVISTFPDKVLPALGTKIDAYIPKPFAPKVLINLITSFLQQSGNAGPVEPNS